MTRVTFGISASSFVANMSLKQNALDFALEYPRAVSAVKKSFYINDGLTGDDSKEAIQLQKQLQQLRRISVAEVELQRNCGVATHRT